MKINKLLSITLLISISLEANSEYQKAFENDAHWPTFVTPQTNISIEQADEIILKSGMRVVMVRAYEDEKIAIADREGTFLIDHDDTDFIEQVSQSSSNEKNIRPPYGSFMSQIARRLYSLSFHEVKTVSEEELDEYDEFLICRINPDDNNLKKIIKTAKNHEKELNENNRCLIILFSKTIPNEDFYNLLKKHDFAYHAVIPIFTKGFTDTEFTNRESSLDCLLLKKSGKIISKGKSIKDIFKSTRK